MNTIVLYVRHKLTHVFMQRCTTFLGVLYSARSISTDTNCKLHAVHAYTRITLYTRRRVFLLSLLYSHMHARSIHHPNVVSHVRTPIGFPRKRTDGRGGGKYFYRTTARRIFDIPRNDAFRRGFIFFVSRLPHQPGVGDAAEM